MGGLLAVSDIALVLVSCHSNAARGQVASTGECGEFDRAHPGKRALDCRWPDLEGCNRRRVVGVMIEIFIMSSGSLVQQDFGTREWLGITEHPTID